MKNVTAALVAAAFAAANTSAQTQTQTASPQSIEIQPTRTYSITAGDFQRLNITNVEARVTTGKPYSADAVTESTQTLSDGNRIERSTTVRFYRDGQGRTRRETLVNGVARTISISDPVAQVNYTLDTEKKTVRRSGVAVVGTYTLEGGAVGRGGRVVAGPAVAGGAAGVAPGMIAPQAPLVASNPASSSSNVKKEDLGQQNIEGVIARGERTTTVIPAGSIGNVNDIKIVSEQWFSDDLQVLVLTKHNDPRSGETTYRLRNIVRAEPDASLFTVPPDYTLLPGGGGRGRGGQ